MGREIGVGWGLGGSGLADERYTGIVEMTISQQKDSNIYIIFFQKRKNIYLNLNI